VLVGDFDTDRALEKVAAAFEGIPSSAAAGDAVDAEPAQQEERRLDLRWRSEVPRLAIAYHAPEIGHPDSYPLQVLAVALAEGKASRLYQRMVEREEATTFVTAEYGESKDPTLFYIRAESCGVHPPGAIEASIHDELARIASEGITQGELDRAKHQIEAHFVFSMERALDQAMLLGQIETLASLDYIDQYLPRVRQVEGDRVGDVAARYLTDRNRTVGWLLGGGEEPEPGSGL